MDDFEIELKKSFIEEATSMLAEAEGDFLDLEKDRENSEIHNKIFRLAHNIKGTSRAVGFAQVAEFTHEFENLILKVKEKKIVVTEEIVSILLECTDYLKAMIDGLGNDFNMSYPIENQIEKIKKLVEAAEEKQKNGTPEIEEPSKSSLRSDIEENQPEFTDAEKLEQENAFNEMLGTSSNQQPVQEKIVEDKKEIK